MATTVFRDITVSTVGDLPAPGEAAPSYTLTDPKLQDFGAADLSGRVVLNIFPSVDTGVCAASVRRFNELAANLPDTTVVCVSQDLPFAQARFCAAEGIDRVRMGSGFRSDFGERYGVTMTDGPMAGLLARSVVVIGEDGTVLHTQVTDEIGIEPDYDAATAALG